MRASLRKLLAFEMTIAEWIGTGLILGVPYLALGGLWSIANTDRFGGLHGLELVLGISAAVLSWPVLLLPNVCAA